VKVAKSYSELDSTAQKITARAIAPRPRAEKNRRITPVCGAAFCSRGWISNNPNHSLRLDEPALTVRRSDMGVRIHIVFQQAGERRARSSPPTSNVADQESSGLCVLDNDSTMQ
jgi:hypothetical protein